MFAPLALFALLLVSFNVGGDAVQCGMPQIPPRNEMNRVKGGSDAIPNSWPWQIRLGIVFPNGYVNWGCGGSILNENFVVTAAHCIVNGENGQYIVRAGDHDQFRDEPTQQDIRASAVRRHENYGGEYNFANDVAILRLERPLTFTPQVSPVCLPSSRVDVAHGTDCMVTGWGGSGPWGNQNRPMLQQAPVQIIGREQCARWYWGDGVIGQVQVCAGAPNFSTDACKGDSGGPLVCQDPGSRKWVLQGIVSFGFGCTSDRPAVYTRVTAMADWIRMMTQNTALVQ